MEYSRIEGFEHVPLGYRPGHRVLWSVGKVLLIFLGLFFIWRVRIIGKPNLKKTQELRRGGAKILLDFDHFSSMDIPLPLIFMWWHGFRGLTKKMFFLIGYRWAERPLIKAADRGYIFPPSEAKKIPKLREGETYESRRQRVNARRNIIKHEVEISVRLLIQQLSLGKLLWFSAHGTRQRSGVIECAPAPNAILLVKHGDWLTPIALEGTEKIMPPQKPGNGLLKKWLLSIPRFWYPLTIIVGEPIRCADIESADELGLLRARLHYDFGRKEMAGYYLPRLEQEGAERKERVLVSA